MKSGARLVAPLAVVLGCSACGSGTASSDDSLTVFAAASLKVPFEAIAGEFEAAHPGTDVRLNFAGSSDLATQIIGGAPADVFASADTATVDRVNSEGLLAKDPTMMATNTLTIIVAEQNPRSIESLESLQDPDVAVVLCAPQVPCGRAAQEVQRIAGVAISPVSEEGSVTDVLGKVANGQADAGLVYVTDAAAAADVVDSVDLPAADQVPNTYPIAPTVSGGDSAKNFIAFAAGPRGQEILSAAGFGRPSP